jgi:hypothetical protein
MRRVLIEKLGDTGARHEHTPRKSLKRLAQKTGVSKPSTRMATKFLNLRPYKTTAIHALQPCDPASRVQFCSRFLWFVIEAEIALQLELFSDEAWFHLQGYINMQR